jgi:hypothetical protein
MGRRRPDENPTLRVDPDVALWARMRALMGGATLNGVIRAFLDQYAAVPDSWWEAERPIPMPRGPRSVAGWEVGADLPPGIPRGDFEGED